MQKDQVPVWQRYVLTVIEAAEYYHIGETKLRRIAEEHPAAAHFGEPLFFCPFCLDETEVLWYNGMVRKMHQKGDAE